MIETKDINIDGALQSARTRAKKDGTPTFVSVTEQLDSIDPFHFFQKGKDLGYKRIYWSSADREVSFVGIGDAYTIKALDKPYQNVKEEWEHLMTRSIISNDSRCPFTGPIALGGFPFDQKNQSNQLWAGFEGSQFRVPAFLLTINGSSTYLTSNFMVGEEDDIQTLSKEVYHIRKSLLNGRLTQTVQTNLILQHEVDPNAWQDMVRRATEEIDEHHVDKIVLARELQVEFTQDCDITDVLEKLLVQQENSYVFAWETEDACFIGATPERLVQVDNQELLSTCLAGTAPRGKTNIEDKKIGQALLDDAKNLEEHQFVVDMIRDAVTSCAAFVDIPKKPILYPLKNLQHLYTPVRAMLAEGYTILDVVERLHPTPALCGYPRKGAQQFIREHEPLERGWYGAPIGWFDQHFNGEFAVGIRSALIQGKKASLFAGCGVVRDSDPATEYAETEIKFAPMLHALGGS
ncbi:isochorismate synthase [Gracilibacillus sp. YIM 98692]|uniref:isochorismate synthase n=1 Tax=Gracilibacillus sp. YIM 98692 TaxID=2663532 RepID=UPI0013D1D000|nr:isochorismate synthase [Gracilibacillus sp. YIM 98692]